MDHLVVEKLCLQRLVFGKRFSFEKSPFLRQNHNFLLNNNTFSNHFRENRQKAVAHHTSAAFIAVVGSEFVQKYLGEGPRMVRDVFQLARENSPAIIFIDEVDAIATRRFDAKTRGAPPNDATYFCLS